MELDYSKIRAFAFDVDGVMTDGGLLCDLNGELYRTFNAKDCFSVRMARLNGYPVAVITGGRSKSILARFRTCGVDEGDVYLNSRNKIKDLDIFCGKHSLSADEVMYFGDDIPDVCALKACGIGICPSDACTEAKEAADMVSSFPGGNGCVRDGIETTLRCQGKWIFDVDQYEKRF